MRKKKLQVYNRKESHEIFTFLEIIIYSGNISKILCVTTFLETYIKCVCRVEVTTLTNVFVTVITSIKTLFYII